MNICYSPERALGCHPGFVAVASDNTVVGDNGWTPLIQAATAMRKLAKTTWVRVTVGRHVIYVAGNYKRNVAIVFSLDTDAVKWLLRTARAMLRDTDIELP